MSHKQLNRPAAPIVVHPQTIPHLVSQDIILTHINKKFSENRDNMKMYYHDDYSFFLHEILNYPLSQNYIKEYLNLDSHQMGQSGNSMNSDKVNLLSKLNTAFIKNPDKNINYNTQDGFNAVMNELAGITHTSKHKAKYLKYKSKYLILKNKLNSSI